MLAGMAQAEDLFQVAGAGRFWRHPAILTVLVVGVAARIALIPISHGQDFVVWDKASFATLHGVNVYAHHPNYPGGPYAYFPLFLDVELPFQWLADHTILPFTTLGKLPILAADIATALLIAEAVHERRADPRLVAIGSALFFLNPLVIYNSAYYGRFDTVGCALLLLALREIRRGSPAGPLVYALAVAAKTFPGFLLAGVLRHARSSKIRILTALVVVLAALSLPYLGSLSSYVHDIVLYDYQKSAQGLSWQRLVSGSAGHHVASLLGYLLLAAFALGTVWLSEVRDLDRYALLTLVLFLLCSKVVLEQYLIWPLPLIAIAACTAPRRAARASIAALGVFTVIGMLTNESIHPWGRSPWVADIVLATSCLGYLAIIVHDSPSSASEPS